MMTKNDISPPGTTGTSGTCLAQSMIQLGRHVYGAKSVPDVPVASAQIAFDLRLPQQQELQPSMKSKDGCLGVLKGEAVMGEAKRRRESAIPMVYHHTSSLRTNLIWMSGVIEVEGKSKGVFHPQLGEIKTDASLRRGLKDFPAVAWFTKRIEVPKCLQSKTLLYQSKDTGETKELHLDEMMSNGIALQRIALGFPVHAIDVIPWPEHRGYATAEGRELNGSARAVGDDPDDWYVSENPVDVLASTEVYTASSIFAPKLRRRSDYLRDVHYMVRMCREEPRAFIPPSWLSEEQARGVASAMGIKAWSGSASLAEYKGDS